MKNDDLKILSKVATDAPHPGVREHAINAALIAFDQQNQSSVETVPLQTQGLDTGPRLTSTLNSMWSFLMTTVFKPLWAVKPATLATATGVLMLPLAGYVGWHVMNEQAQLNIASDPSNPLPKKEATVPQLQEMDAVVLRDAETKPAEPKSFATSNGGRSKMILQPTAETRLQRKGLRTRAADQQLGAAISQDSVAVAPPAVQQPAPVQTERYTQFDDNETASAATRPVSTFSIDVDTASYARVRAALNAGNLPPKDMVRVEEMINYFDYSYPLPATRSQPFKPTVSIMPTPWNADTRLMQIGIKGFDQSDQAQPDSNLVLLLDVSGSMNQPNKLPLLVKSFRLLLQKLKPTDKVSIVTYAGRSATVLDSEPASRRTTIVQALENLQAGGSTAGEQGIEQAYRLAEKNFIKDGVNRIMLATDGDFNVGLSDPDQLKDFIAKKRKSGIFLSVFGFGQGNYNDALMQTLAQNGNGQAAYIDTLAEAQKALVEEAGSTMFSIASDVKIQVEFDPAKIAEYRLIGYETRALKRQDFNNDKVDAGDIGAGHTVTALYELTPVGSPAILNTPLRYGAARPQVSDNPYGEIGFLKMRYKLPGQSTSQLLEQAIVNPEPTGGRDTISTDAGFATAVAAFGQKLRGQAAVEDFSYPQIIDLARANRGDDRYGYRSAFIQLVRLAAQLSQ